MSRVELIAAAAAAAMGCALAGCSAMPDWAPDWMSSKPSGPVMQTLNFDSDPPGANVRTVQGQTCFTPCALAVPSEPQSVTFTKEGFVAQTVSVNLGEPPDHSFWQNPPPSLVPNPVKLILQAVPPSHKPVLKRKPRRSVSRTRTAAKTTPPPAQSADQPPAAQEPDPAFPPPPAMSPPAGSPFPPPPAGQ